MSEFAKAFMNELWNTKATEVIDYYFEPYTIVESPISATIGAMGKKKVVESWFQSFPDVRCKVCKTESFGSKIIISWECKGTHENDFLDIKANSIPIVYTGNTALTLRGNKIVEYKADLNIWVVFKKHGIIKENPSIRRSYTEIIDKMMSLGTNKLSFKEVECISLWLLGMSSKEAAKLLNVSDKTIDKQRAGAKEKLQVYSKVQLFDKIRGLGVQHLFMWHAQEILHDRKTC